MAWPPSILVIEDDPLYRMLYARSIARLCPGALVELTGDGAEAMARLADGHYDVVLTDLHMPTLDGCELLARIKREPRHADLVVLVVSAFDDMALAIHRAGYRNVFTFSKPLRADHFGQILLQSLKLVLETRAAADHREEPQSEVDTEHLALYAGPDPELQRAIGEQFILHAPTLAERLQSGLRRADFKGIADIAHDIHAATTIVGAHRARRLAHRLLMSASARDLPLTETLCRLLSESLQAYRAALLARPGAPSHPVH